MKKMMMIGVLAAVLAGCGGEATEPSTVSKTVTQSETTTTYDVPETAAPEPDSNGDLILQMAWDKQTADDQYAMCFGWGYDRETMIDTFFAEAGGSLDVTRDELIEFFDGKCG